MNKKNDVHDSYDEEDKDPAGTEEDTESWETEEEDDDEEEGEEEV